MCLIPVLPDYSLDPSFFKSKKSLKYDEVEVLHASKSKTFIFGCFNNLGWCIFERVDNDNQTTIFSVGCINIWKKNMGMKINVHFKILSASTSWLTAARLLLKVAYFVNASTPPTKIFCFVPLELAFLSWCAFFANIVSFFNGHVSKSTALVINTTPILRLH